MNDKMRTNRLLYALMGGLVLVFLSVTIALASGKIDPINKWAWSTNAGWINFNPNTYGSVTVYSDHLEGYAWGENIGWIRLGTYDSGGEHTYVNDSPTTYGVNNDGSGSLSGYAWSTNVGWINFDPEGDERVTINRHTGEFYGYAWGENIGWIHFKGGAGNMAYGVVTAWRGERLYYFPLVAKNAQ